MLTRVSLLVAAIGMSWLSLSAADPARVLIVVGPSNHPPGSHEVAAGGRLLKHALEEAANVDSIHVQLVNAWPDDAAVRAAADTVVFLGDTFPPMRLPNADQNLAELAEMMQRGCGIVCIHYATGLRDEDVGDDGAHPLLQWMGGYFATRCRHHQSIAKIYPSATIEPAMPSHPVSRGWQTFTLHDEPYINNYFGQNQNKLGDGVVPLATSMLPPEEPRRETVAWGVSREDGGRGFGIVMPHFYRNWADDDLRTFILNGVVWTAQVDVPEAGVRSPTPNLAAFDPESVQPQPRRR